MRRIVRLPSTIVLSLLLLAGPALAQTGYTLIADEDLYPLALLYRLDLTSGEGEVVGPLGAAAQALAFDAAGTLYAANREDGLLQLDIASGAATPIGPFGVDLHRVHGIAFDSRGVLWMLARPDGAPTTWLYEVDPMSGAASARGPTDRIGSGLAVVGDRLYSTAYQDHDFFLAEIDPEIGEVQLIGSATTDDSVPQDLAGDPARGDLLSLGAPWASTPGFHTPRSMRIDPATGAALDLARLPFTVGLLGTYTQLSGLAIPPVRGALDIPALGTGGAAILIVLLAIAGLLIRRGGLR